MQRDCLLESPAQGNLQNLRVHVTTGGMVLSQLAGSLLSCQNKVSSGRLCIRPFSVHLLSTVCVPSLC